MNDYGALAVNGYRWVNIHGPYASTAEKAVERLTNYRTGPTEAQIIEDDKAYYLIPGTIVQIIKEDPASGMSQVQLGGFSTFLWTYSRFLSKHPIPDEEGKSGEELFFELALEDLRQAAHLFHRTYEATCGVDGWVSLEVSPLLAHDTRATLAKAEELYARANRRQIRPGRRRYQSPGQQTPGRRGRRVRQILERTHEGDRFQERRSPEHCGEVAAVIRR